MENLVIAVVSCWRFWRRHCRAYRPFRHCVGTAAVRQWRVSGTRHWEEVLLTEDCGFTVLELMPVPESRKLSFHRGREDLMIVVVRVLVLPLHEVRVILVGIVVLIRVLFVASVRRSSLVRRDCHVAVISAVIGPSKVKRVIHHFGSFESRCRQ